MKNEIIKVSNDFWNIRGSFKIKGLIDIGTHASLVKRKNGKFIFLDSLSLDKETHRYISELTNNGKEIEAVFNLHPFHTVHVERMHELFPSAKHYGTLRHLEKFPHLNWQKLKTEEKELHELFSSDLNFSVPQGVEFISSNENIHFSSVLAYHPSSKTIHVDDTLMYIRFPKLLTFFGLSDTLQFHPTLTKALEQRSGATDEFKKWAEEIATSWSQAENICAAHTASFIGKRKESKKISKKILKALQKVLPKLKTHNQKFKE
jgi:hypothetical protein